jgi:ribulose-5-phosphate 4-epimerase/fuculose-1-phosphate aldolase
VTTTSALFGGEVPLGAFIPIGGTLIGEEIVQKIGTKRAIIMKNHGVFTIGKDAQQAFKMAVEVEEAAKITAIAMSIGQPVFLTEEQLQITTLMYQNDYGQK